MRTGSVFRAISKYLSTNKQLQWFQFENVTALAAKPKGVTVKQQSGTKSPKRDVGPSNLSAVCHVLDKEAGLWSHVWQLDAREFGSGQQRTRLYGSSFPKDKLYMPVEAAHCVLSDTMNMLVNVAPCHPDEYLLGETSEAVRAERSLAVIRSVPAEEFINNVNGNSNPPGLDIAQLFRTGGGFALCFELRWGEETASAQRSSKQSFPE